MQQRTRWPLDDFNFFYHNFGGVDLGNDYKEYKGVVYYWYDASGQAVPSMMALDLDMEKTITFTDPACVWDKKYRFNPCPRFAKDDISVYRDYSKIEEADPKTFELVHFNGKQTYYAKDKNAVFHEYRKAEGSDPKTFQALDMRCGKDANKVFYQEKSGI